MVKSYTMIHDLLEEKYKEAKVKKCEEHGKKIRIHRISNLTILKGEKIRDILNLNFPVCDCIIFHNNSHHYLILAELKGKPDHAKEIKTQLKNGTEIAQSIIDKFEVQKDKLIICHLIVAGGYRSKEKRILRNIVIKHRGRPYKIRLAGKVIDFSNIIEHCNN